MKYFTVAPLVLLTASCALSQTNITKYEWKATLRAVDESGNPINGANAKIGYYANSQPVTVEGLTDTNGIFSASHSALASMVEVGCQAEKPGYYTTWVRRELGPKYDPAEWFFTQTLILKKIDKPIAMYAKQINSLTFPEFNKIIGYDLMEGDWVKPYGKGINSDMLFIEHHGNAKSGYTFTVSFPQREDGIQEFFTNQNLGKSELRSPHEAPMDGYQPKHEQIQMVDPNRNYFFRVRTVLDPSGNVKSALYGKIYGDFMQFTYYLNPTPNDRNLEFDPKHNLLSGLKSFEQVSAP